MTITDHYRGLADRGRSLVDELISDAGALTAQTTSHNFLGDFEALRISIKERPEATLLAAGITEYQFALYALSIGSYRHAFISLRLTMELLLGAIHFSAFEIKYRKWTLKSEDIVWGALVDKENGVFANNFIGAFFPDLRTEGPAYRALAETVYRECSEYVHGNYHTHRDADLTRTFDSDLFSAWHERADTVRLVFIFAFAARYLALLPPAERTAVEGIMMDSLGSLAPIRDIYATPGAAA